MNPLEIAVFVAFALCIVTCEGTAEKSKLATQPVYHTVRDTYNYRQYGLDSYKYDPYRRYDTETYGVNPASYDRGAQRLHLSGGIYRPYGYDDTYSYDTQYSPYAYDNAYKYHGSSASQYAKYPYSQYRRY